MNWVHCEESVMIKTVKKKQDSAETSRQLAP